MILTHGSLFSGIGGFELGAQRVGIETLWNCEIAPFNRKILKKNFPQSIQYEDVTKLQFPPYVDIISGGFPCQDISAAGRGEGITGSRSGLWSEYSRIIREVNPRFVIIENSPQLLRKGFEKVLYDLSQSGYDAEWQCLSGASFGMQHFRERVYIIAYRYQERFKPAKVFRELGGQKRPSECYYDTIRESGHINAEGWGQVKPALYGDINDIPNRVDRVASCGNAVMPEIAQYLFECIKQHAYDTQTPHP
jgi:DNA (cytosine-5)-methyltransferase 1